LGAGAETPIDMDLIITSEFRGRSGMRVRCIGHVAWIVDRLSLNKPAQSVRTNLSPVAMNVSLPKEKSL
jgi:hypothetical protein